MIVLGLILTLLLGFITGITMCLTKMTTQKDIAIMLFKLTEQLKRDREEAQLKMNKNIDYNINCGKYIQASQTMFLIKKLYEKMLGEENIC